MKEKLYNNEISNATNGNIHLHYALYNAKDDSTYLASCVTFQPPRTPPGLDFNVSFF